MSEQQNKEDNYQRVAGVFRNYFKSLDNNFHVPLETKIQCLQRSLLSLNNFLKAMYTFDSVGMVLHSPELHLPGSNLPIQIYDSKLGSNDYKHWIEVIKTVISSYRTQSVINDNTPCIGFSEEGRDESQFRVSSKDRKITAAQICLAKLCMGVFASEIWEENALKKYNITRLSYLNKQIQAHNRFREVIYNSPVALTKCLEDYSGAFEVINSDPKLEEYALKPLFVWDRNTTAILSHDQNKKHLSTIYPSLIAIEKEINNKKQMVFKNR